MKWIKKFKRAERRVNQSKLILGFEAAIDRQNFWEQKETLENGCGTRNLMERWTREAKTRIEERAKEWGRESKRTRDYIVIAGVHDWSWDLHWRVAEIKRNLKFKCRCDHPPESLAADAADKTALIHCNDILFRPGENLISLTEHLTFCALISSGESPLEAFRWKV